MRHPAYKPTAQSVLTSPNDLDLGMQEFLASLGPHPDPNYQPPSAATVQGIKSDWITNQFPIGSGVNPAADINWQSMIDVQKHSFLPGAPDLTSFYQPGDFGTPPPSPTLLGATQTANQYLMENQQPARPVEQAPADRWQMESTNDAQRLIDTLGGDADAALAYLGGTSQVPADRWQMESTNDAQRLIDAMGGSASEAERYISDLQVRGDETGALRFAEMYAEESGVDLMMDVAFDPSAAYYDADGTKTPAASYGEMSPTDRTHFQDWYNSPAVQEHYSDRATFGEADPAIFKDFAAVQHFVSKLPSAAEVEAQAVKDVTQAEVDAYLKELDAMSDEDYNQIVDNLGLSSTLYKGTDAGADKSKFGMEGDTGSGLGFRGTKMEGGPDAKTVFDADMDRIVKEVAKAKSDCAAAGNVWGPNGCEPGKVKEEAPALVCRDNEHEENGVCVANTPGLVCGEGYHEENGECVPNVTDIGPEIKKIFGPLVTDPQHGAIRARMAELGTTDLTQAIRNEFATITTPDYSADILQRYDEMGTALGDAAAERSRVLEETTTRAEGRIGDIKTGLKSELEEFEVGRVEQQTAIEAGVIERTTKMETDLVDRLDDIRIALGDQVTSEFEEVAALAGTLTSSQATSSRDAISRLTQIGNMAAAARLSAPAELSAEALTALSDLEFKVENEISQGLADSQAQVKMQKASALLQETMRRGSFETEKQRALVESILGETLRGTVYEDRTKEMLAQALMQEDQYVRQFNEGVDQQLASAQLQNLFGTQDYERQLDMMNLTRSWQTADTLQGRGWQTADTLQGRGWQTDDMTTTRGWQTDDMTTGRGWQEADYTKALADDRADLLTERGWQEADVAAGLARELAAQPDPTKVLTKMRSEFPGVPDSLFAIAMHLKDMDWDPPMAEARIVGADWVQPQGWVGTVEPVGGANPGFMITEQIGPSAGEAYLRSLGEGVVLSVDELTGAEKRRSPQLSAEDYGSLQAMSDFARSLDSRADLLGQIEGMSVEELERFILGQGSGASTPWTPGQTSNPTGNTTASAGASTGSSNASSGDFIAGIPLTTSPQGLSALLAGLLSELFYDR